MQKQVQQKKIAREKITQCEKIYGNGNEGIIHCNSNNVSPKVLGSQN